MHIKHGVSLLEVVMVFAIFLIVAMVAIPSLGLQKKADMPSDVVVLVSAQKVRTAYAFAMAEKGNYPRLSEIVDYIDADFASENNQSSGVIFRGIGNRLTVNTYSDIQCKFPTNGNKPGVSDVVRCI